MSSPVTSLPADGEYSNNSLETGDGEYEFCDEGLILPILNESNWPHGVRVTLYFAGLLYCFVGVSIVTDVFMTAIQNITSVTRKVYMAKRKSKKNGSYNSVGGEVPGLREDEPEVIEVRIWNDTVANLTLMALGTSAPEILLAVVEIIGNRFEAGDLGPGTIVGSAAFNLFFITAVCILAVPNGESRRISRFPVFVVTSLFAFLAYLWLLIVLGVCSPNEVELWEAIVTFVCFPLLTFVAYSADRGWLGFSKRGRNKRQLELGPVPNGENEKMLAEKALLNNGKLDTDSLVAFIREVRKYDKITDEDAALLAAAKVADAEPKSHMWYRIGAVRSLSGSRKLQPRLTSHLNDVYKAINEHPKAPNLGKVLEHDASTNAIIEFHAPTCAVKENVGKFQISVWRHGNLEQTVKARVESIDGSAEQGKDYVAVNEILTFGPNELEKTVAVEVVDDNQWEPTEEFFLKLSLTDEDANVKLGKVSIMEITILDDDEPGIVSFEKRGLLVKESSGFARATVVRRKGASGDISIQWRTIDRSAVNGRDYIGGSGELIFRHFEVEQYLEIPIIDDLEPEKDEHFEIELFEPTGGAKLGNINRLAVTITNDDAFNNVVDHIKMLTEANIDKLRVHRSTWGQQIKDALTVNGGDVENATCGDYFNHFICFSWKVLFSLIPPPTILKGWVTFFVALAGIGLLTAIIGDLAGIFGCMVGLPDTVTAITLVAVGTSLPDTFASVAATRQEVTADNAIGNINGSNSVNVFLGLGLPWLLAAIYHAYKGTRFIVPAGPLGFSVLIFSIAAVLAIAALLARRYLRPLGRAELGGPFAPKIATALFFFILWLAYLACSILQVFRIIELDF